MFTRLQVQISGDAVASHSLEPRERADWSSSLSALKLITDLQQSVVLCGSEETHDSLCPLRSLDVGEMAGGTLI